MQDFSNLVEEVENTLIPYFRKIEKRALFNQEKVLNAFHHVKEIQERAILREEE